MPDQWASLSLCGCSELWNAIRASVPALSAREDRVPVVVYTIIGLLLNKPNCENITWEGRIFRRFAP